MATDSTVSMTQVDLSLPKSNLKLVADELRLCSANDEVIARHPLECIEQATVVKQFEPVAVLFASLGVCLAYFPYLYVPNDILKWLLIAVGGVCLLLGVLGAFGVRLQLQVSGTILRYPVNDAIEHAQGFAITINHLIRTRNDANIPIESSELATPSTGSEPKQDLVQ